jgi:hypothetical protein
MLDPVNRRFYLKLAKDKVVDYFRSEFVGTRLIDRC